ncbi:MAG: hypothetical protein Q7R85_00325 [bacterium]|nr:hypothetical protein [bacterium]
MSNRIVKQFLYGMFYLLSLTLIGGSVYLGYFKPAASCVDKVQNQGEEEADCGGPCVACAVRKLRPIKVLPLQLFDIGNNASSVLVELENPNLNYGASHIAYTVTLYDAQNAALTSFNGDTFIHAGEVKLIVFPALEVPFRAIMRGDFVVRDSAWLAAGEFPRPNVEVREVVTKREGKTAIVEGVVQNNNSYGLRQAVVSAVAMNHAGLFADASRTVLLDIQPFEERFFKIVIPLLDADAATLDTARTRVVVDTRR